MIIVQSKKFIKNKHNTSSATWCKGLVNTFIINISHKFDEISPTILEKK
jgi:hypothetical protein